MKKQTIFDIEALSWEEWDEIETGFLQFYNVKFPFESMKKYNGMDASIDMNGEISVTDENGEKVWKGFAAQIPEFFNQMCEKFGQ